MLSSTDLALKEMAAFALGRLAQNTHNQAGIVQVRAGTPPRIGVLDLAGFWQGQRTNCSGQTGYLLGYCNE
jgi:hypothetical protein